MPIPLICATIKEIGGYIEGIMEKIILCISLMSMPLANAGIHSNPTLLARVKILVRKALKSRATPYVLGGLALTAMPYKKLFRDSLQNYAYDSGSSYASKWLPWPMSSYLREWNRMRRREQMQMKISYALFGAAVATMLMQQSSSTTQRPMIVNKIIVNNGEQPKITHEDEWADESEYPQD